MMETAGGGRGDVLTTAAWLLAFPERPPKPVEKRCVAAEGAKELGETEVSLQLPTAMGGAVGVVSGACGAFGGCACRWDEGAEPAEPLRWFVFTAKPSSVHEVGVDTLLLGLDEALSIGVLDKLAPPPLLPLPFWPLSLLRLAVPLAMSEVEKRDG